MSNYTVRDNFKDIFGVYFLESLSFEGDYDMPIVGNFDDISVIDYIALYSDTSEYNKTENTCVAFYQYDHVFDGIHGLYNSIIYKDEERLDKFRERFKGVKYIIAPDYSLFGDFPNALQIFNIWKQINHISVLDLSRKKKSQAKMYIPLHFVSTSAHPNGNKLWKPAIRNTL